MGTKARGFTIIETMLVLAITGALAVAILVGTGLAISQQRYRDTLNSMSARLQDQYGATMNVTNTHGDVKCSVVDTNYLTVSTSSVPNTSPYVGQADCMIIGRYFDVTNGGKNITISNVLAQAKGTNVVAPDITTDLTSNYAIGLDPNGETDTVPWGDALHLNGNPATPANFGMLIVRSPSSGLMMTYAKASAAPIGDHNGERDVRSLINAANTAELSVCVDPQGSPIQGQPLALRIAAKAANVGGVSITTPGQAGVSCS